MKKYILYLLLASLLISCSDEQEHNKKTTGLEAPEFIHFEMKRLRSPLTGDVPSHLKYQLLKNRVIGAKKDKNRLYPNSWQAVDDQFASLAITQLVYDPQQPNIMYFCTGEGFFNIEAVRGAGVWKSTDAGESWFQLSSTDTSTFYYCQDMMVHPETRHLYVCTREAGLMRSLDFGNSWEQVLALHNGSLVNRASDLEIAANGDLFVSMGVSNSDGIYYSKSGDAGSWEKRMNGFNRSAYYRIEMATAASDSNIIYAIPEAIGNGGRDSIDAVYRSDDQGLNWYTVGLPGGNRALARVQAWYDLIIKVDPTDPDVVVAGGLNLWRSRDGGQNWLQLGEGDLRKNSSIQYVHVDQHDVIFQNSDTVYFTNDGGIYKCDNFRADTPLIYEVNQNYNVTQFYSSAIHPDAGEQLVMGGTQDNGSNRSLTPGIADFERVSWADGGFAEIDHDDPTYWYTTTQFRRLFRTHNGVRDTLTNPNLDNGNTIWINPMILDVNDPTILYQASNQGIWRLRDARSSGPSNWQRCTRVFGSVISIATSKSKPNLLYFGRDNSPVPLRVEDAHITDENYTPIFMDRNGQLPDGGYLNCILIDPEDEDHVILVYTNYDIESVFETFNATANDPDWQSAEGNLPNIPIRWAAFHPTDSRICYLATEMGVYYTDSLKGNQTTWKKCQGSIPNTRMDMIRLRPSDGTFVVGTHGRGIYLGHLTEFSNDLEWEERGPRNIGGRTRTLMVDPFKPNKVWAGSVSGGLWVIDDIDSVNYYEEIPDEPLQLNVFPNPSSSTLNLEFNSTVPGLKRIRLYDRNGRLVFEEELPSDQSLYSLDNRQFARGLYFIELVQAEQKLVKKVIFSP